MRELGGHTSGERLDMNTTSSSDARTYRLAGYLTLAHAALIFGILASSVLTDENGIERPWLVRGWVALVTLWFFWPVVLALHRGRSAWRLGIFGLLGLVIVLPSLPAYSLDAPSTLGMPFGAYLNPLTAWQYFSAYRAGRAEARKDVAAGIMAMEVYGLGGFGPGESILRKRYGIDVRSVADCIVNAKILGHAAGYNEVAEPEIDRRVGRDRIAAARAEGARLAAEQRAQEQEYDKVLTKRFSNYPDGSKIVLKSVEPYLRGGVPLQPETEEQLGEFVQKVSEFVCSTVPADSRPFELRISATLTPAAPPHYETSGSLNSPSEAYLKVYRELPALPLPPWQGAELSVTLKFAIHAAPAGGSRLVPAPDHGGGSR